MGEVVEHEYICFAEYVKKFKMQPEFNDKKRSPKKLNKDFLFRKEIFFKIMYYY